MKPIISAIIAITAILISGCNSIQPVLLLTPGDIIMFILIDLVISGLIAGYMTKFEIGPGFWFWFVVGLIFLPALILAAVIKFLFRNKR